MISPSQEVQQALGRGKGVVALESTIIAHGLPYPENLAVATALEAAVREEGAIPATIAVVDGVATIGMGSVELERLARGGQEFRKLGASDVAVAISTGTSGATTVSGTALLAARMGIRLFATGGIGGVHRGDAWDVSQDLSALAAHPIAVVSAGPKAILDLPRTAEALESLGVPVIGVGTDELPAFYTRTSGVRLEHRMDDPTDIARFLRTRWELHQGGVLLANPIPEEHAIPRGEVERWIAESQTRADAQGVRGKALTPFLLAQIAELTEGRSVEANRALALSNARLAARVAVAFGSGPG